MTMSGGTNVRNGKVALFISRILKFAKIALQLLIPDKQRRKLPKMSDILFCEEVNLSTNLGCVITSDRSRRRFYFRNAHKEEIHE